MHVEREDSLRLVTGSDRLEACPTTDTEPLMPRKKFVAGNWKMYTTLPQAKELAAAVAKGVAADAVTVAVCPPFPWLAAVAEAVKGSRVAVGAQDCAVEKEGAFTGQVSAPMLLEAGCKYAIIGHSERRHGLGETDELLNRKIKAVLSSGLVGVFCIGELLAEREANQTESVLRRQLTAGLAGVDAAQVARLAIAYEPVWAIGTGRVAPTSRRKRHMRSCARSSPGCLVRPPRTPYRSATAAA